MPDRNSRMGRRSGPAVEVICKNVPNRETVIDRAHVKRVRDFGCGELLTIAEGDCASLHYFERAPSHPRDSVEHVYPSHSLVFTDSGRWKYHGTDPASTVDSAFLVVGAGRRHYSCEHESSNRCFIVALGNDMFDVDDDVQNAQSVLRLTTEMRLHRRAIESSPADSERVEALAFSLYDLVLRASGRDRRRKPRDLRMSYAKRLMKERSREQVTVSDVAREIGLSRFTFTRRFLASESTTPHAYITAVRIARAKELLRRTTLSIEEIALANGFGSTAHFSNAFRRLVGTTPTNFRMER
jgi:AraC-like DNA-binding protein